jgi:hypothetical protein
MTKPEITKNNVDADETASGARKAQMESKDGKHGERAQAIDVQAD